NGKFYFANRVLETISEYSTEELKRKYYWDLIHPDYQQSVVNFYKQQFNERRPTSYLEFKMVTRTGSTFWIGQNVKMFFDEDTWISKVSVIARDISELKVVQQK